METIWSDFIDMKEYNVFSKYGSNKILYGKFKDIYIPLINKEIICSSLNFYNPNYIKGKIYKKVITIMVRLFNSKFFINEYNEFSIDEKLEAELKKIDEYKYCAVCKREDNINKDYIIQLMNENGSIIGYAKYPRYADRNEFVVKEVENLNYINTLGLRYAKVPKILLFNNDKEIYIQSTEYNLKDDNGKLNSKHIDFLSELYKKTKKSYRFKECRAYIQLTNINKNTNDEELIDLSNKVLENINLEEVGYCYSHGDFYPSNIKLYKNLIYVYDWEDGRLNTIYYDLFHYIVNNGTAWKNKDIELIIDNLLYRNKGIDAFEIKNNINNKLRITMFIIYLYEVIYDFATNMNVDKSNDDTLKQYIKILKLILERS